MRLFLRKSTDFQFPLCVAYLTVANIHLFYTIPFSDESGGIEKDNAQMELFWSQLVKSVPPMRVFEGCDMFNTQRIGFAIDFDLTFEPGAEVIKLKRNKNGEFQVAEKESGLFPPSQ